MKIKKFLSVLMAFSMLATSACNIVSTDDSATETYSVKLILSGGEVEDELTSYTAGAEVTLPVPTREYYDFVGWYDNSSATGDSVTAISATDSGDKIFYAKWTGKRYSITLNADGGVLAEALDSYQYLVGATLPEATKKDYLFDGWFDSATGGNKVESISPSDNGNKEYWAHWTATFASVSLVTNGGTLNCDLNSYSYGIKTVLPDPERVGYDFNGWYDNEDLSGTPITEISSMETGDKVYWAKWTPKTYNVMLNADGGVLAESLNSYTYGEVAVLPVPSKNGFEFNGWYTDSSFTGDAVTEISASDFGDKIFFAKWTENAIINLIDYGGYNEGAYVEFDAVAGVNEYTVSYRAVGSAEYLKIDSELVRLSGNSVRADILGIAAGNYEIMVAGGGYTATCNVNVAAYDRSGYAHFNSSEGVGAYNNDGTPKTGATIIYVSEENKNTVTAKLGTKTCTGIVDILANASKSDVPLIIRILGRISAATWNEITYEGTMTTDNVVNSSGTKLTDYTPSSTSGSTSYYTQADLIAWGFNKLNTSVCSELNGLTSRISYTTSGGFDSMWNNCAISQAKNVTVEGVGNDAEIFQWGMTWSKSNSIEIRNVTFTDYTEDACSFEGGSDSTTVDGFDSQRIWVHNCTFNRGKNCWDVCNEQDKADGDGATDFKRAAYITVSYNHYINNHKTGLVGSGDTSMTANVTFHHNFYENCESRLPLARQANIHMYNNYYLGSTGTNMSIRANGYAFIENCYFENAKYPVETQSGGVVKMYGCIVVGTGKYALDTVAYSITVAETRDQLVENSCTFGSKFDTDSSLFYYDAANNKTDVTYLTSAEQAKDDCVTFAGVMTNAAYSQKNQ